MSSTREAPVLLLSDLHLPIGASPYRAAFRRFLNGPAHQAAAVYLLGDLFDFWIGDDAGLRDYAMECADLAALTAAGVPVYFQHGNRDFLVGAAFAAATGVQILPDYHVAQLPDGPALLCHGDSLCVDDHGYQRFRRVTRGRRLQRAFLALPSAWRWAITRRLQRASRDAKSGKMGDIMDVNPDAVIEVLEAHRSQRLIHGHTHRPGRHVLDGSRQRVVLADWRPDHMAWLAADAAGLHERQL